MSTYAWGVLRQQAHDARRQPRDRLDAATTSAKPGRLSRSALLAGASLAALAALAEPGASWAACAPSTQTISTGVTGPVLANGGSILATGPGSIAGGAEGVFAENCSITTLSNQGSIGAASGAPWSAT